MKRHAIVTSCNAPYGEFLIRHWLASLQANVNLTDIDVAVLDYGLTDAQRQELTGKGVRLYPTLPPIGHIANVRWRDMASMLGQTNYDQLLCVDGGDIIFQADISHLFEKDKDSLRGVPEEYSMPVHDRWMSREDFYPGKFEEIWSVLKDKPIVNAGFLLGPAKTFATFWDYLQRWLKTFKIGLDDQFVINHRLYTEGFVPLESKYNHVMPMFNFRFTIKNGVFLDEHGERIPVVHNAGLEEKVRIVRNFGYGPDRNYIRWYKPFIQRLLFWWHKKYRVNPWQKGGISQSS